MCGQIGVAKFGTEFEGACIQVLVLKCTLSSYVDISVTFNLNKYVRLRQSW